MRRKARITQAEFDLIADHVLPMIEGTRRNLDKLPLKDTHLTGNYIKGQRTYYTNTLAALNWVVAVAHQRLGVKDGGGRQAV